MYTSLITSLTLATAAFAAPLQPRQDIYQQTIPFGIYAVSAEASGEYDGYALVNAHVGAGQNALRLLDPTSRGPADLAYLDGTQQDFYSDSTRVLLNITGAEPAYEIQLPDVKTGSVGQVFREPGEGTASFSIGAENYLETAGGSSAGFVFWYACPTTSEAGSNVPSLFYGVEVQKQNLPSEECKQINIQARFQ
ncbi:hypothetical protein KC317_g17912 [Hortaea werneckii]|nr:hypothetical protein KC352_g28963 [Hortaea werneckii]KAI7538059.1 hypothetical protein KC317_g17912 [Hortaea werneckii]